MGAIREGVMFGRLTSLRPFRPRRTGTEKGSEVTRISANAVTKRHRTLELSSPSSMVATFFVGEFGERSVDTCIILGLKS